MKKTGISELLRSKNTVFSFKDIALLWGQTDSDQLKARVNYYVKTGQLYPIRRGFYAKDKIYDKLELATKIYTPSYVSFETILRKEGVIFQHYDTIFTASYLSRNIACDGQRYAFKKLKNAVLLNPLGLIKKGNYTMASKERAFMDAVYLYKNYYFDNLQSIDWQKCFELLPIYKSKALAKILNSYYSDAQK